jgi:hypothetical protein
VARALSSRQQSRRAYAYDRRLTPQYKDRLRYQGIGREDYVRYGFNAKRLPPLTRDRREGALQRIAFGSERPEDMGLARRWYASRYAPSDLRRQPGLNKVATAATLSQVTRWGDVVEVSFVPTTDPVWTAFVSFSDGTQQTISVPGYVVEDVRAWLADSDIENDIGGTP